MIKGRQLEFSEIEKIKRNPLAMTLPLSIVSGVYGTMFILTGTALAILEPELAAILIVTTPIGLGLSYVAVKPPNVLKGYNTFRGWKYVVTKE